MINKHFNHNYHLTVATAARDDLLAVKEEHDNNSLERETLLLVGDWPPRDKEGSEAWPSNITPAITRRAVKPELGTAV